MAETLYRRHGKALWLPRLRHLLLAFVVLAVLGITGQRVEIDRLADGAGAAETLRKFATAMYPPQLSRSTPIERLKDFDPERLPPFSRIESETVTTERLDPATLQTRTHTETRRVLIEDYGYVAHILAKTLETFEISLWATLIAVGLSLPLSLLAARPLTPHPAVLWLTRGLFSLLRAVPELISALFMVLIFGFGPLAGVLALGLHGTGFLGKFYAEDIENAPTGPQDALRATGANRLKVFGFAIWPQVLPQFSAYTVYLLDRNFRMATMIGLVGAGGIGQELKGRYDLYDYRHVATIVIAIIVSVLILEVLSARLRKHML